MEELKETMARLRAPDGCPWDREQTHQSIARCLVEECAELLDTIDRNDMAHMREELGDVLLQVVFHAQMAEEVGHFSFDDVAAEINQKLVRRHPHVFGTVRLDDSDAVLKQWDEIKAGEKKAAADDEGLFKRLPPSLPALLYAWDVVKQLQKKGMVDAIPARKEVERVAEELDEETAGEKLFALAAACRIKGIDPESALRRRVGQFIVETENRAKGGPA